MFNEFGLGATINRIIAERRNDIATIKNLFEFKKNGRDRTGVRALPSSQTNVISGDKEGDEVLDGTELYQLRMISGALQWVQIAVVTSFTNP